MSQFPAHIRVDSEGQEHVQTTQDHNQAVADYAAATLRPIGLSTAGELCGLLHDAGKLTKDFRTYITRAARKEDVKRGSVNHTFSAVRLLFERYHDEKGLPRSNLICEILAFAVGSHHGQFDGIDPEGRDGFTHRLTAEKVAWNEARANFYACTNPTLLDKLYLSAASEVNGLISECTAIAKEQNDMLFYISLISRMLLSALIDADRRDTAEFMLNTRFPVLPEDMGPIWKDRLAVVEQRLEHMPIQHPVDRARGIISRQCGQPAAESSGIYRLSVPTGSGKTLASLRFALSTASAHKKRRIIFVSPLLSILEQNAAVIRDYIADDHLILEHHSNVVRTKENGSELDMNELLTETWDSPIILTTFVQLLNTLFDGKTSSIRRMAALIDSVIVIDEIQSLPGHMYSQFNLAINFLTKVCHSSVLLCSATQPCLENVTHPMYLQPPELAPYDPQLWQVFKRTKIINQCRPGGYLPEELAGLALSLLPEWESLLMICNKKDQARQLYQQLCHAPARVFHLSTSMCMAHRIATMEEIKKSLGKEPVICVATQLVESGVDLSFGCVIRVVAGMDNIVQAAGRCNRNGAYPGLAPVYIVNYRGEDLSRLGDIRRSQIATEELLASFDRDSAPFGDDLQSEASIQYFYRRLFGNMPKGAQDYPVPQHQSSIYQMLSKNAPFRGHSASQRWFGQAMKTAGEAFKVFDQNTEDVLVPYGDGKELITDLCSQKALDDLGYRMAVMKKTKGYTVSLFSYQIKQLEENGGLKSICKGAAVQILENFYSKEFGLLLSGNTILAGGGII